jgi:serine/threonine protein kinase
VVREIKIHMFLEHPNIAKLYGCFHDAARIYLVEEYCTDQNLYEAMRQPHQGRLTHQKSTQLVAQIGEAVSYIHRNAIIHRDIKP